MMARNRFRRVVGLTASPAANGLIDLWAQFRILDYGKRLGRFIGMYRAAYFRPDKTNGMIVYSYASKPGAEKEIYERIGDITVSMKADEQLRMSPCVYRQYTDIIVWNIEKYAQAEVFI